MYPKITQNKIFNMNFMIYLVSDIQYDSTLEMYDSLNFILLFN